MRLLSIFDYFKIASSLILIVLMFYEERVPSVLITVVTITWAVLCITGLIGIILIFIVIGIATGAGGAQADCMSDGFVIFVFIIMPTCLSVFLSFLLRRHLHRKKNETVGDLQS